MNKSKYKFGHKPTKRRRFKIGAILLIALSILGFAGSLIYTDLRRSNDAVIEGNSRVVSQVLSDSLQKYTVNEPLFSFELPGDWEEVDRRSNSSQNSIEWKATLEGQSNRTLTLYVDTIPADYPINRLLPIDAQGARIKFGNVSDACYTFTGGGTANIAEAVTLKPAPAKWQEVDFICNLPDPVKNVVATGSPGITNGTDIVGLNGETHRYFFVFNDQNIQPKYSILYDALRSFSAK